MKKQNGMSDKTTYAYDTECDIMDLEVGIVKNVDAQCAWKLRAFPN